MNKRKIIATFLLSANLFGSAFFSNTSACQISTSDNNEKVKVQTENDTELTFLELAKELNETYNSLRYDGGFFRIYTLDLSQVSNIDEKFFSYFNEILSNSSWTGFATKFIKAHHKYSKTYDGLVALGNKDIKIILSDDMTSKIINNPSKYGIDKTTIIYQNIPSIRAPYIKSEKNSYIDWKKHNLENILIEEYKAHPKTQTDVQFARKFIEDHKSDLIDASTKNCPYPEAITAKIQALSALFNKRKYRDGIVSHNKKRKKMEINAIKKTSKEKKPRKPSRENHQKKKRL